MPTVRRAVVAACLIFAGAVVGNWLVPAHDLADAKGVITTVQGVVSALLAIVLGLLIWTSYGVYAQQHTEMLTLAVQVLQLDVVFDRLGVSSRALMGHPCRMIRRMRYGTSSSRERHDDRGGPSSDTA